MTAYTGTHARKALALGLAVACAMTLAACGGSSGSTSAAEKAPASKPVSSSAAASSTTGSADASQAGKATASGVAAVLASGTWKMAVSQAGPSTSDEGISLLPGDEVIVVAGQLTNGASTPQLVKATSFTMRDDLGSMYSIVKTKSSDCVYNMTQPVAPGGSVQVKLLYEVPKAVRSLVLEYAPQVEGGPAQPVYLTVK